MIQTIVKFCKFYYYKNLILTVKKKKQNHDRLFLKPAENTTLIDTILHIITTITKKHKMHKLYT